MSFTAFLRKLVEDRTEEIQQGMVCKIESFDKSTMRADVQPLLTFEDPVTRAQKDLPKLPDVPVQFLYAGGFYIRPQYSAGDLVWVTFATHDVDEALDELKRPISPKTFGIENAMVVGGLAPNKWTPPAEFGSEDGLLIGEEGGAAYIKFGTSDITFKAGTLEVKIDASGIEVKDGADKTEITAGDVKATKTGVFTTLKAHQHPTAATGPPSPPLPNT